MYPSYTIVRVCTHSAVTLPANMRQEQHIHVISFFQLALRLFQRNYSLHHAAHTSVGSVAKLALCGSMFSASSRDSSFDCSTQCVVDGTFQRRILYLPPFTFNRYDTKVPSPMAHLIALHACRILANIACDGEVTISQKAAFILALR